jgi:hypothetical protein
MLFPLFGRNLGSNWANWLSFLLRLVIGELILIEKVHTSIPNVIIYHEKISWIGHVRNEEVLRWVKEQRNILHEISKRNANWIWHILHRNCLLQHVIERNIKGAIEVTGRWGRRHRKLLDDPKERRGYSHLKGEALDRTMWRARFGRGFGLVVMQTTKSINVCVPSCTENGSHREAKHET